MAGTPPAQRTRAQWTSPVPSFLTDNRNTDRNTELSHKDALTAAQAEHDRVREAAIRVYHSYELQEETKRLQEQQRTIREQQRAEEQRIRQEEQLRAEQERLRALKAKTVPPLPPQPDPPAPAPAPPAAAKPAAPPPSAQAEPPKAASAAPVTSQPHKEEPQATAVVPANNTSGLNGVASIVKQPASGLKEAAGSNPFNTTTNSPFTQPKPNPFGGASKPQALQTNGTLTTAAAARPAQVAQPAAPDRYVTIHQNLKKLRASIAQQAKASPALKTRLGDMRRELRKNMGQLVSGKGGNKTQVAAIQNILKESLAGSVPSELVDPHDYITDRREPVQGAQWNEPQLPSLFLYLLNQFSKAIINQFVNECGAQPKSADPVGVVAAMIFSNPLYLWRGKSLVDILMAKLRVGCPVLFGYRGSEKTEQGRLRLGWKKDGPGWIPEQAHIDRMKGLGVGYAAISMRDFSRSANTNPWPPRNYWTSLARILNTPPDEISNTQCVVVRAMLETYEERFIGFYGSQAIAAMRKALIEFPARIPAAGKSPGVLALQVLPDILKRDLGIDLS
ncbi:GLE1-like protein-domain-containing protein [Microdochium trichocladiopsis]|uniref:mRNA export factor GLE1 n=1 Tax=Microdochium trichocladiopsis TaxID=1682393 RepID=A0A9P8YB52_9PEZI|nr:GLE1-like protein-domain-containing protein [Microdochium trichocladiopsis]KAH7032962.1 GLE1-like protein-domain-containing protein [Microdochium trichocladiopsis]